MIFHKTIAIFYKAKISITFHTENVCCFFMAFFAAAWTIFAVEIRQVANTIITSITIIFIAMFHFFTCILWLPRFLWSFQLIEWTAFCSFSHWKIFISLSSLCMTALRINFLHFKMLFTFWIIDCVPDLRNWSSTKLLSNCLNVLFRFALMHLMKFVF